MFRMVVLLLGKVNEKKGERGAGMRPSLCFSREISSLMAEGGRLALCMPRWACHSERYRWLRRPDRETKAETALPYRDPVLAQPYGSDLIW